MKIPVLKISEKVNILYCKYCTRTTTMHPNPRGYTSEYQTHNIDLHILSDLSDSKLHMSIFTPYVSTLKTSQLLCTVHT